MEEIQLYLDDAKESMLKAVKQTEVEFQKVRAGKASPAMLQGLSIFNWCHYPIIFNA